MLRRKLNEDIFRYKFKVSNEFNYNFGYTKDSRKCEIIFIGKMSKSIKKEGFDMKYFYESVNEYENAVKNNGWKVIDFGGKRERFLSALIETKEGKLEALLILR